MVNSDASSQIPKEASDMVRLGVVAGEAAYEEWQRRKSRPSGQMLAC